MTLKIKIFIDEKANEFSFITIFHSNAIQITLRNITARWKKIQYRPLSRTNNTVYHLYSLHACYFPSSRSVPLPMTEAQSLSWINPTVNTIERSQYQHKVSSRRLVNTLSPNYKYYKSDSFLRAFVECAALLQCKSVFNNSQRTGYNS